MSFLNWLYGDSAENVEAAAAADARLRQMNADAAARGRYDAATIARIEENYGSQVVYGQAAQDAEVNAAFVEGWNEGKGNVSGFIGGAFKIVKDVLGAVLFGIPAWAWVAALAGVWLYMGRPGWKTLKAKLPA